MAVPLAALLFPLMPAAFATGIQSDLDATEVAAAGAFEVLVPNLACLRVDRSAEGSFALELAASAIRVAWSERNFTILGRPSDPQRPQVAGEVIPPTRGERWYSSATAVGRSLEPSANILLMGNASGLSGGPEAQVLQLQPAQGATWAAHEAGDFARDSDASMRPILALPANSVQSLASNASVSVLGNFSFFLWSTALTVANASESQEYRSGTWTSFTPLGSERHVWQQTRRLVRVDVIEGNLTLQVQSRETLWAGPEIQLRGDLATTWLNASGVLNHAGARKDLRNERLELVGQGSLVARNITGSTGPRLSGQLALEAREGTVVEEVPIFPPEPEAAGNGFVPGSEKDRMPWGYLWALIPLFALYPLARTFLPFHPTVEDVEWALLHGRVRRAARLAPRILRRRPLDADVLFLYASALLALGRFDRILERVEPSARRLRPASRTAIAFVLAEAAAAANDQARALRWAEEVRNVPALFERLTGEAFQEPRRASKPAANIMYA